MGGLLEISGNYLKIFLGSVTFLKSIFIKKASTFHVIAVSTKFVCFFSPLLFLGAINLQHRSPKKKLLFMWSANLIGL